MPIKIISIMFLFFQYDLALAQVYKCKNTKGRVIYSESPCPTNTIGSQIIIEPNVIDSTEQRRQMAISKKQLGVTATAISPTSTYDSSDVMPLHNKETRIRELSIAINDENDTREKREDARNELAYLKDANPKNLSYDLEQQRRNLKIDLVDFSSQKRAKALSALASIYTNYR